MDITKQLGLELTPAESTAAAEMAGADGDLSRSAVLRKLIDNAASRWGVWPPHGLRQTGQHIQEVQNG